MQESTLSLLTQPVLHGLPLRDWYAAVLSGLFLAETIVGVNKYALEKEVPVEVFTIDNSKVIAVQVRHVPRSKSHFKSQHTSSR